MSCKRILLVTCVLILGLTCVHSISSTWKDDINGFMGDLLECSHAPGMTLTIVQDGVTILAEGYGLENVELERDMTNASKVLIASNTKHMAAVLIGTLLDQHPSYNWDTPVRDIIGHWFHLNDGYLSNVTSVTDMLSHRTGVEPNNFIWYHNQWDKHHLMESIQYMDNPLPFRTKEWYNSIMYGVIGEASEILGGGTSWEQLMKEHLFEPLGMEDTHQFDAQRFESYAQTYTVIDDTNVKVPVTCYGSVRSIPATGFVMSTPLDMGLWMTHLLSAANENETPLVTDMMRPETTNADMPAVFTRPNDPVTLTLYGEYGRGLWRGHYRGYKVYFHSGYVPEYVSQMWVLPDLNLGIFSTQTGVSPVLDYDIAMYVIDVLTEETPWFNASDVCQRSTEHLNQYGDKSDARRRYSEEKRKERVIPEDLDIYEGIYGNYAYGNITISLVDNQLHMFYGETGDYHLIPGTGDSHFDTVGANVVSFIRTIDNGVSFVKNDKGSFDTMLLGTPDNPVFHRDLNYESAPSPEDPYCWQ